MEINTKRVSRALLFASICFGAVFLAGSLAKAAPTDPFTPKLSVSTTDTQAGAHPVLTIGMDSTPNQCNQGDPATFSCTGGLYIEQDLKKEEIELPAGLMADINAGEYCNVQTVPGDPSQAESPEVFLCENEDPIGTADVTGVFCDSLLGAMGCFLPILFPSLVYNEKPQAGEQGRLVVLLPKFSDDPSKGATLKSEVSIKFDPNTSKITALADNLPDVVPGILPGEGIPVQVYHLFMTLDGNAGSDTNHPLLTNPTSCPSPPGSVDVEFQGYASNAFLDFTTSLVTPGSGQGTTVTDSAPYPVAGCENVPYNPAFSATSDTNAPGVAVALSTTITQQDDESPSKRIQVDFPKGTGINLASTVTPCSASDLAAETCTSASKMGTATAASRLIPNDQGPLTGDVFLTSSTGANFGLSIFLKGFIDLRIDGSIAIGSDNSISAVFDNIPQVQMSSFKLDLLGGNQSLIKNPSKCGSYTTTATFTSHSGKTTTATSPSQVTGCDKPSLDVELSETGAGKKTTVELEVNSSDDAIKSVTFALPRYLHVSGKKLGKKPEFGKLSLTGTGGSNEYKLRLGKRIKAKGKKKKKRGSALRFNAGTNLSSFRANLFTKKVKSKKKIRVRGKLRAKTNNKRRLTLKNLPTDNLSRVNVELNPDETRFIRNPRQTKRPLRALKFLAFVTTEDGSRYVLKQKVKLKRKKSKRSKKK